MDDDLLPRTKQYSIVHRDRWKPPGHPDEEVKQYETDDLDDVPIPPEGLGISVLAYDTDGNMCELSERD
ncbi:MULTISPECIES: hypothetical protein [Haloferax]|uniref:Uncharacterized protein n=2 Tax=Haloferax TaxID=2251 RepID=A0A6G1YZ47_9EURY|nr:MULTISPECIES: hypothetical protein [Haloferax]KAB1186884.1 hypothetical protein Hfx1149_02110 [Haloferax sp. CBA1149]MRW79515.1 hypothetical protein [Haloferax marinisediminis]